jgi:hypothetical protein
MSTRIQLTRSRNEWWNPTGDFATRPGRQVYLKGRVIGVDPVGTSPNVVVGVAFSASDTPIFLRPGEFVTVPATAYSVFVTNPIASQYAALSYEVRPAPALGHVSLVTGDPSTFVGWRANRTRPSPTAALIGAGLIRNLPGTSLHDGTMPAMQAVVVPTNGLESLRVTVVPVDANYSPLVPPADLAGTVRVWRATRLPLSDSSIYATIPNAGIYAVDPDTGLTPGAAATAWSADSASDFAISQYETTTEFPVGSGGLVYFQLLGLAGTGVLPAGLAWAFVEGV